jgi:TolB-like protein/tetratricopeptide (TPR) repeat protein
MINTVAMTYRVGDLELDPQRFELRRAGSPVAIEPQVLSLLFLLVENRDRLLTKDEIIAKIWNGRIVSESAMTSRIKSARQAVNDDGEKQSVIRTVHGKGYRFVAEVQVALPATVREPDPSDSAEPELLALTGKPSIAVLPFELIGADPHASLIADALPHEIIAELARLRWLFVIARNSSFQFRGPLLDIGKIGKILGVRYCLSGSIAIDNGHMQVTVELSDTQDRGVIWADHFAATTDRVHEIRAHIIAATSTALEIQIPLREAQHARLKSPENLDSWAAYHIGLQHSFRFNQRDNAIALGMFERAIRKDPEFARAHAGLSFAHFQNAFLNHVPDVRAAAIQAKRAAEHALEIDALDPFANFTFGRSLWLEDNVASSLMWLDRSIVLSPNYAQGRYAKAWAETVLGNGDEGQKQADAAMTLSPIDPLLYAMLATRALAHLARGEYAAAVCWGDEAGFSPGSHGLIALISAACQALNGNEAKAIEWARIAKKRDPNISQFRFFRSFPFEDCDTKARIADALSRLGV